MVSMSDCITLSFPMSLSACRPLADEGGAFERPFDNQEFCDKLQVSEKHTRHLANELNLKGQPTGLRSWLVAESLQQLVFTGKKLKTQTKTKRKMT